MVTKRACIKSILSVISLTAPGALLTSYCAHYKDVLMSAMASQVTGVSIVCSSVQAQIKENNQSSVSLASNADHVSISWCHHDSVCRLYSLHIVGALCLRISQGCKIIRISLLAWIFLTIYHLNSFIIFLLPKQHFLYFFFNFYFPIS